MDFGELKITRQFTRALEDLNITKPTEIQEMAIPRILAGQDVIGIAQTGTGKTAAYLLPLLQLLKFAQGPDPRCLILVPTKELVVQVNRVVEDLAKYTDLKWVALYGGIGPKTQIEKLREGTDLIITTPGRLLELYARGEVVLARIRHMVLDECDRMMDMGFWPQLRDIQEKITKKKQQLLFSATFPDKVQRIADNFLLFPTRIEVTPQATPAATVRQWLYEVPNLRMKMSLLVHLLSDKEVFHRVLVFTRTKEQAVQIARRLQELGITDIQMLHSNKSQNARIHAVDLFRSGEIRVLVSTDVSARGLDIEEVSHVINFNVPGYYEDYVHRIGRTGRALRAGTAISFVDESEEYHIKKIEQIIHQSIERLPLPAEVQVEKTSYEERQLQLMEIDRQKRKEDPTFKGAFHEKKHPVAGTKAGGRKNLSRPVKGGRKKKR